MNEISDKINYSARDIVQWLKLSQSSDQQERWKTIMDENLPVEIMWHVAGRDDPMSRVVLAKNKSLPEKLFQVLANDELSMVCQTIASHPNCPQFLIEQFAKRDETKSAIAGRTDISEKLILEMMADNPNVTVRFSLAGNPMIPREVAEVLAKDEEAQVRRALAFDNPKWRAETRTPENTHNW